MAQSCLFAYFPWRLELALSKTSLIKTDKFFFDSPLVTDEQPVKLANNLEEKMWKWIIDKRTLMKEERGSTKFLDNSCTWKSRYWIITPLSK